MQTSVAYCLNCDCFDEHESCFDEHHPNHLNYSSYIVHLNHSSDICGLLSMKKL